MTMPTLQQALETAMGHHRAGRLREAEVMYRQILSVDPRQANAMHLLGVIASQVGRQDLVELGRLDDAIAAYQRAIALNPRFAGAYNNLGNALQKKGTCDAALGCFERAIDLQPDSPDAHLSAGNICLEKGRLDEAVARYQRALQLRPDWTMAHSNLGSALQKQGAMDAAISCFEEAIRLQPDFADPHYNLGNICMETGHMQEAVARYRKALALRPDWSIAYNNMGNALCALGEFDAATKTAMRALALWPADPLAHWNYGLMLLREGNLQRGLPEYEWRWQARELGLPNPNYRQPRWDGGDLLGRRILLYAEQGFGDTIQFIRYLPSVAARGGHVIVACQPELLTLLTQIDGAQQWIPAGQSVPEFDVHCPLASLPGTMRTELQTIPAAIPYLHPDPRRAAAWGERLGTLEGLKVGIAWAGRPSHPRDAQRSISLERLAPLASVPGVTLISLQKGNAAAKGQSPTQNAGIQLIDWTEELADFSDTAALIARLDLVITVDTAVGHLAGAMGKRAWVLLPIVPDWRWMLGREDSPWYPTLRLFRQDKYEDWSTPIARAAAELGKLSAARAPQAIEL
ncbi:MAG: tetratricopeptide repeat-containing glycosyltransferase family protein [Tepidisphaeraceae bacterium]